MDMHSGGGRKTDHEYIYIELPEREAIAYFEQRFDQDPRDVACECCGSNFSIDSAPTLEQASGYDRGCDHVNGAYVESGSRGRYQTLDQWLASPRERTLVVRKEEIE
jgi:hypothetical protein